MIRSILAPNASPLTLDGTRTYVVGRERAVVIDPGPAIDDYIRHRREREAQVVSALQYGPLEAEALVDAVYGDELHPGLRLLAVRTTRAYLEHLERAGRVRRVDGGWGVVAG